MTGSHERLPETLLLLLLLLLLPPALLFTVFV